MHSGNVSIDKIQAKLLTIRNNRIIETTDLILQYLLNKSDSYIYELVDEVFYVCSIRPFIHSTMSDLIGLLMNKSDNNLSSKLHEFIVKRTSKQFKMPSTCLNKSSDFKLANYLNRNGTLSNHDLEAIIRSFTKENICTSVLCALYFAPRLGQLRINFNGIKIKSISSKLYEIIDNIEYYSENNWEQLNYLIENSYEKGSLCDVLKNNSPEEFSRYRLMPTYNHEEKIQSNLFETVSILNDCTQAEFCAFYGSETCFRYFLLSMYEVGNPMKFSAAGGNISMMRLCTQYEDVSDKYLQETIKYRQSDILKWLLNYHISPETSEIKSGVYTAIETNFIEALIQFLDFGANLSEINILSETPLHVAVRNHHPSALRFLIKAGISDKNGIFHTISPFRLAFELEDSRLLEEMTNYHSEVNEPIGMGYTYLH